MATATRGPRARGSRGSTRAPKRGQRILFLGITGVDKPTALTRLNQALENQSSSRAHIIDFEREYLWPVTGLSLDEGRRSFLDSDLAVQWDLWGKAWQRCIKKMRALPSSDPVFLSLHGCFLRKHYGARCTFDPGLLAREFEPDLVITLIDDVYEMWWRTEKRADAVASSKNDRRSSLGRPSLEQLVVARRQEVMVGDLIARTHGGTTKNLMLSVNHPIRTFTNCVLFPRNHKIIYLSFPISQPRRLEAQGDLRAKQAVSRFVQRSFERQLLDGRLIVECPLAIDELPLVNLIKHGALNATGAPDVIFDRAAKRWDLNDLCAAERRLAVQSGCNTPIPAAQLLSAAGNIDTDVTFRDYRLVDQANCLLVFNPILTPGRERVARSVRGEIDHAIAQHKQVYVFQDKDLDPKFAVWEALGLPPPNEEGGQMEEPPDRALVTMLGSIDELLNCIQ